MNNLFFCRAIAAVTIIMVAGTARCNDAQDTIDVVGSMPATSTMGQATHRFADEVTRLTAGSLTLRVKRLDEVGSSVAKIFDQVDAGEQQMFAAPPVSFWIKGQPQAFGILLVSGIPFGFSPDEFLAWYYEAGGQPLVQQIYDRKSTHGNVIVLPLAVISTEPPGFFVDPIPNDPDAFNATGITYRINFLGSKAMQAAFPNLNMVTTPPGIVPVDALCTGKIHGAELGTLSHYEDLFFDRFSHPNGNNIVECGFKHLYLSSWQQLMLSSWLAIDRDFFARLKPHEQQAILSAAQSNVARSLAIDIAGGAGALRRVAAAGAIIHASLPPKILTRLREKTAEIVEQEAAADPDFAQIVASMKKFAKANQAALIHEGIPQDARFNRFPGWQSDYPLDDE